MAIEIMPNGSSSWREVDVEVNGDESSIDINGTTVYVPVEYVDDFTHGDLDSYYYLADDGQATLPSATTAAAHRTEEYGLNVPFDNPNTLISLPSDHSAYDSTEQPNEVENYPSVKNGDVVEFYFRPTSEWDESTAQARFVFAPQGYAQTNCIRVRLTGPGYWRIEDVQNGTWDYYGDPDEDNFDWTPTNLHRVVISFAEWPDINTYLYDIDGGSSSLISTLSATNGPGTDGDRGFGWWWNGTTAFEKSGYHLIDEGDI